jgi:prevent-host-death family protein
MTMKELKLGVSDFKAKCLGILDQVASNGDVLIITKHGRPIAKVTPITNPLKSTRDRWKGIGKIKGDIVRFNEAELWENG